MSTPFPRASRRPSRARSSRRACVPEEAGRDPVRMARPVTLITGASAGLGVEFARQCAGRGEELVLVARRRDRLEAIAAALATSLGGRVHIIAADLSLPDAAASLIGQIEAEGLAVDTLINNAGFGLVGRFAGLPPDRQRQMVDLNVRT